MSDFGFGALVHIAKALAIVCVLMLPFAIWKLIEIVMWLFEHVRVTW